MFEELERKIAEQQGKEGTPVHTVGCQLLDMCRENPGWTPIVSADLDVEEMSLAECAAKIKKYADRHKTGNFAFVSPQIAEKIIREFYDLSDETRGKSASSAPSSADIIDLDDFLV